MRNDFVQYAFKSLHERCNTQAQEIIQNLSVLSSSSNQSSEDLINNPLVQKNIHLQLLTHTIMLTENYRNVRIHRYSIYQFSKMMYTCLTIFFKTILHPLHLSC
jgi:hypothetical protein